MLFGFQSHDPQSSRHGPLARGQDRPNQQDLGMFPDPLGEQAGETRQDCGIFAGQGKSRPPSWRKDAEAYLGFC